MRNLVQPRLYPPPTADAVTVAAESMSDYLLAASCLMGPVQNSTGQLGKSLSRHLRILFFFRFFPQETSIEGKNLLSSQGLCGFTVSNNRRCPVGVVLHLLHFSPPGIRGGARRDTPAASSTAISSCRPKAKHQYMSVYTRSPRHRL